MGSLAVAAGGDGHLSVQNIPARNSNRSRTQALRFSQFRPVTGSSPHENSRRAQRLTP
jgi:hypothetical protein